MKSLKNVINKFPENLKEGVIELYEFIREEYVIKREEFEELKSVIVQLVKAQQKTEERLNQLAQRVDQLTIAQQKTEERLNQLTEAQEKTEKEIRSLTITVRRIQKELGGLSHSVGFDLEN